jgi:hypothetical protein
MKYVLLFALDPAAHSSNLPDDEQAAVSGQIMAWWEKHSQAGTILNGAKLQPTTTATTVRLNGDKPVVSDGPFVEAKEVIGGYGLIEVAGYDEALALAETWPALALGQAVEIRPVDEM